MLRDFDALMPPKREAKIFGVTVDVSIIPARLVVQMNRIKTDYADLPEEEQFYKLVELVAEICNHPDITSDRLLNEMTLPALVEFQQYVLEPLQAEAEAKNPPARRKKTSAGQ